MRKFLSLCLTLSIVMALILPISTANAALLSEIVIADVKAHYDSYVSYDGLCSNNIISSNEAFEISMTEISLTITGTLEDENLELEANIDNGTIDFITDSSSNFEVLSVQNFTDVLRFVVKNPEAFDIYFIDIPIETYPQLNLKNYQPNWFAGFIETEIVEAIPASSTYAATNTYYKVFSNSTSVYGDIIYERLVVGFVYEWDRNFTGTGDFKLNCGISENYTEYTPYGGNTIIWNESSLNLHDPYLLLSTDKGDYISSVSTNVVGTYSVSSETFVDYSLNIPNTDFSLSITLPRTTEAENGASGYFTFPADANNKVTRANIEWMAEDYYCYMSNDNPNTLGHNFEADIDIKYVDAYAEHNTTKKLNTRWDFRIYSDGNCNGYAVNTYTTTSSFF